MPDVLVPASPTIRYVPTDLDATRWSNLEPYFRELFDRPFVSFEAVVQWLHDLSDLIAVESDVGTRLSIAHACNTEDEQVEKAYLHFFEEIEPKIKPLFFALQKKLVDSPHVAAAMAQPRLAVLVREWQADVELFREQNVPLQTQVRKLVSEYGKLCGRMMVDFRGEPRTLQQLARFLEETDRDTRQQAWELGEKRRLEDRERLDNLFDQMLALRQRMAGNAGLRHYREYAWIAAKRFDYTPDDCHAFADAVEKTCMPLVEQLDRQRAQAMGLDRLRPWDLSVDPKGRPPLRPFDPGDIEGFLNKSQQALGRIDPRIGGILRLLRDRGTLDLESRRGKRPGGFQATLEIERMPFIFMNAAGMQRDVETLVHEVGHALHTLAARAEPLVFLHHAPLEFCEVASMGMELLTGEHLGVFYSEEDAARAFRQHLEGVVRLLPWIATIDQFQHWVYTHPGHSVAQRTDAWLDISGRFSSSMVNWDGHEDIRASRWQRQLHLYHHPFYYIEYGIAQLGAMAVWHNARRNRVEMMQRFHAALALGGTRPLPELFEAGGGTFDFSAATVEPLMARLAAELDRLQD